MFDRHGGPFGEHDDRVEVVVVEVLGVCLLRQVQMAPGLTTDGDRHLEHARSAGRGVDGLARVFGHARRKELAQPVTVAVEHTEFRVARAGQLTRHPEDPVEHVRKLELGGQRSSEGEQLFEEGFEIVAEAGDVDAALRAVLGHKPDVLVLDLTMPGTQTSLEALPGVRERSPQTATVVLTMQEDPGFARHALRAGALGYVLKEAAGTELVEAVRRAAEGQTYLNPSLGAALAATPEAIVGPPDDLSEREAEVLRLIALGHTNGEIGEQLFLSVRTVETHRAHVQQKLGRSTRAELVLYALDHDLMGPSD